MIRLKKILKDSQYEIIVGLAQACGVALGSFLSYPMGIVATIIGAALGGIVFRSLVILTAKLIRPRYTISSKKLKNIFLEKCRKDITNFYDSNISVNEANFRMLYDSKKILSAIKGNKVFNNEITDVNKTISWLKKGSKSKNSFVDLMSREDINEVIKNLVRKIKNSINVDNLIINSSIVEPGCLALVEKMKSLGVPIIHKYKDINGIEQARTLSSELDFSASFIPYSTILLSKKRSKIIEKYDYLMPITFEDQRIIGKRDMHGEFDLSHVVCPIRGSGHYELLTMLADKQFAINTKDTRDLSQFKGDNKNDGAIILYQPVADVYLEAKRKSGKWGFLKNLPFPIDIILIVNKNDLGEGLSCFKSLVLILLSMMKDELLYSNKEGIKLFKNHEIRNCFDEATDHFASIIRK